MDTVARRLFLLLICSQALHSILFALAAQGYFPGVYTAPLLPMFSALLATRMMRRAHFA